MLWAMAEQPVTCDTKPLGMEMEPGSYWWCACGRSAGQPFCDGSHQGTGIQPVKHEVTEAGTVWWCQCKHSGNSALCDGSHRTLG